MCYVLVYVDVNNVLPVIRIVYKHGTCNAVICICVNIFWELRYVNSRIYAKYYKLFSYMWQSGCCGLKLLDDFKSLLMWPKLWTYLWKLIRSLFNIQNITVYVSSQ